jgi:hypothetical protein
MLSLLISALISLPPVIAVEVAENAFDIPGGALVRIMKRESRGMAISIHDRDAWASRAVCIDARRDGWLDDDVNCRKKGWSTRGIMGLMAAYNLKWLGLDRHPWILDIPIASALAAARKYRAICPSDRWRWCPRRKGSR